MSAKSQHNNILLAIAGFVGVVIIVAIIGFLVLDRDPDIIQGQVEVFGLLAEGIGESRLPFADGFSAFGATYLTEFVG